MRSPSHSSWFDQLNYLWWAVQIIKLLVMYSCSLHSYFVSLRPKYLPQHPVLEHLRRIPPAMWETKFRIHKKKATFIRVYFILYIFGKHTRRQKTLDWRLARFPRVQVAVDFVTIAVLICLGYYKIFILWHNFKLFIAYLHFAGALWTNVLNTILKSVKEMLQHKINTQLMGE